MASDHDGAHGTAARRTGGAGQTPEPAPVTGAAHRRSPRSTAPSARAPRPRVEVHLNELTGTMSWRAVEQPVRGGDQRQHHGTGRRTPGEVPWSARAAALRSAGLDPSRAPARGAAPIPTHPAAVRAALSVDVASLGPEQLRRHLARVGALRSGLSADLTHGTRMPTATASRLRSTTATPAHAHALAAERTSTVTRTRTPATARTPQPGPGPGPVAGPRR